jgi:hypothetical protein
MRSPSVQLQPVGLLLGLADGLLLSPKESSRTAFEGARPDAGDQGDREDGGRGAGVPFELSADALFNRKDLLEQAGPRPPTTLDELLGQAGTIKDQFGLARARAPRELRAQRRLPLSLGSPGSTGSSSPESRDKDPSAASTSSLWSSQP